MLNAATLPPLRDDLAVLPGAAAHDGAPTWTLHDPLSNRFFRLSWPAFEVLSRWHLDSPEDVAQSVRAETPLDLDNQDVVDVVELLARGGLLKAETPKDVDRLLAQYDGAKTGWLTWALHHYLFFRIPLVRPDAMLEKAFHLVAWMGTRAFRLATLAALLAGLLMVGRQWDSFAATFVDHFSLTGLAAFGIALAFAKIAHELGHAFAAKTYGCRVLTMGVAFLVLWPMLYTDVNEAWKLTDRRQKLMIGGAGILVELTIAAWAMLAWGLLPEGIAKSMAFTLTATTLISSLSINLSPFMRFDGYFLAMDALDQPNLHPRSFALARWHLREVLFGLDEPVPEHLPAAIQAWMIVFAWAVWLYRLVLFLGIAVLVYHFFIKLVGILLFVVEIGWFVVKPVWAEIREWHKRLPAIRASRRVRWPLGITLILLLLLLLPWSGRVSAPAILKADQHVTLYAPSPAVLAEIMVAEGQAIQAGTVVVRLDNPDLALRRQQIELRIGVLKYELSAIGFEESFRNRSQSITKELAGAMAEKATLAAELARLTLTASITGAITDLSPNLQPGQWINGREPILAIRSGAQIEAYVAEADFARIRTDASTRFIPEGGGKALDATIAAIDRVAVKVLTEPSLAALYGGDIPARFADKALVPDGAFYRVRLSVDSTTPIVVPLRGQVHINGERQSLVGRTIRSATAILIREWGF